MQRRKPGNKFYDVVFQQRNRPQMFVKHKLSINELDRSKRQNPKEGVPEV